MRCWRKRSNSFESVHPSITPQRVLELFPQQCPYVPQKSQNKLSPILKRLFLCPGKQKAEAEDTGNATPALQQGTGTSSTGRRGFPWNSKHLICDDSFYNRLVLKRFLTSLGIEADEAESAEEGIAMVLKNGRYAIVWMDIVFGPQKLPGTMATYILRKEHGYPGVIIGLSAYANMATFKACMGFELTQLISKPFNRDTVREYTRKFAHSHLSLHEYGLEQFEMISGRRHTME